jgi:hypothetical protein
VGRPLQGVFNRFPALPLRQSAKPTVNDVYSRLVQAMQKKATTQLTDVEEFLISHDVSYEKKPDGTFVTGHFHLFARGLTELPDLSKVIVTGSFSCANNKLTSLKGCPQSVAGTFYCDHNALTTLEGAPLKVGGSFYCPHNQLTSLRYAPKAVGGGFGCDGNQLTSLEGAPDVVEIDFSCNGNLLSSLEHGPTVAKAAFDCSDNRLTSLRGAPVSVGTAFLCDGNELASLEGAPQNFKGLKSDFGTFASWSVVPDDLRLSPETRARLERDQEEALEKSATVLQAPLPIHRPIRFRM